MRLTLIPRSCSTCSSSSVQPSASRSGEPNFRWLACWFTFFSSFWSCFWPPNVSATPAQLLADVDHTALDQFISQQIQAEQIPGVSLALFADHQIVHERGFGISARSGTPMDPHTPSALGSLSKSFTAIAVMQLVDEGAIRLDVSVADYLPEFDRASDERFGLITVRQLLNHTSGISTYDGNFGQADYSQRADAFDRLLDRLLGTQLIAAPGKTFEYSNGNYQILGLLLERIDAVPFEVTLRNRVIDRLKLANSFVFAPNSDDRKPAEPFRFWLQWPAFFDRPTARSIIAQGGVYSSAHDVAIYLLDLMSAEPKLLSTESRDQLFVIADAASETGEAINKGYGLGWFVERRGGYRFIYHGGSNPGYETIAGFVPEHGRGFVALVNAGTGFVHGNVAGLIDALKKRGMGVEASVEPLPSANKLILLVLGLIALVLLFLAVRWCARLIAVTRRVGAQLIKQTAFHVIVPSVIFVAIAYALLIAWPRSFGIPLPGLMAFAPDIGLLLAVVGSLAGLNFLLRSLYFLGAWLGWGAKATTR